MKTKCDKCGHKTEEIKTIRVPEIGKEVDVKLTYMGKKWKDYVIPPDKYILTFSDIAFLYQNKKYRMLLGLDNTNEFFRHPSNDKLIGYFCSRLVRAGYGSLFYAVDGSVDYADVGLLGVRFVSDLK